MRKKKENTGEEMRRRKRDDSRWDAREHTRRKIDTYCGGGSVEGQVRITLCAMRAKAKKMADLRLALSLLDAVAVAVAR